MQITAGNAWLNARAAFLPFGGVVGVGYGPKLKAGKVVAHLAIVVLVDRKLPPSDVESGQLIPPAFEGLPTDVRVPELTPRTPRADETRATPGRDFCLTDYQWIDWPRVHRRRLESRKGTAPQAKPPKRGDR